MKASLIALGLVAAVLFLLLEEYSFTVILLVFLLYIVALAADLTFVRRTLVSLGETLRVPSARKKQAITSCGAQLYCDLEELQYRLESLQWQMNQERTRSVELPRLEKAEYEHGHGERELFERVLIAARDNFRCSAAGVVWQDGEVSLCLVPAQSERFTEVLKSLLLPLLQQKSAPICVVLESGREGGLRGDLSPFGVRTSLCVPFRRHGERGLVWLGYPRGRTPSALEQEGAVKLGQKLSEHLDDYRQFLALAEKVAQLEGADQEKNRFIAHMSHDIRSPINNVKAILELVRLEQRNSEDTELLDTALRNCGTLNDMVEDLLDYSRFRAGQLDRRTEALDLLPLVSEVCELFAGTARLRGLELVCRGAPGLIVDMDKRHARRIVANLVSNALKYTPAGIVSVSLDKVGVDRVRITVTDTGLGMGSDQLQKLFTPFARFHDNIEGVGLGLTVSKILVERNGGTICAHSEPGRGSSFSVEFELASSEQREVEEGKEGTISSQIKAKVA